MTARQNIIAKKILDHLHGLDGGMAHRLTIHAETGGLNLCSAAEFEDVFAELDRRRYLLGVADEFKGAMWKITTAGKAARLEM